MVTYCPCLTSTKHYRNEGPDFASEAPVGGEDPGHFAGWSPIKSIFRRMAGLGLAMLWDQRSKLGPSFLGWQVPLIAPRMWVEGDNALGPLLG